MRPIDVASLVTGIIMIGFSAVTLWFLSGQPLLAPGKMWFATVLAAAGITGLAISLGQSSKRTNRRRKQ